ncbi:WD40 repeat-like protein [Multifurca ochricompacta]|uniref:Elongator complex protein 2 n=1 Tax=Multifurca ochricompacta TaxID=376703 RepID=A0AAD4M680_9AGAM|nr:WD40 repeat-like protein [Multifurca ochricompacta]
MVINTSVDYISASANRFNHTAAASGSSLVAFGSGKLVSLWDAQSPSDHGVFVTLSGHDGLVTCVEFIDESRFLSADDTGYIRLWRTFTSNVWMICLRASCKWALSLSVQAHTKAITALCAHTEAGCIITGGSDSLLKVWKIGEQDDLEEVETILLKGRFPLAMELAKLPQSSALILAVGSTDRHIQIFTRSEKNFVLSATISGHEDWVRAICFRPPTSPFEPLILASGSQDANIRLWNIEALIRPQAASNPQALNDELLDAFEASLGEVEDGEEGGRQISLRKHILTVKTGESSTQQFSITFDALLVGHEAGVTSLSWRPLPTRHSRDTLLSTSTDSSLILWSPVSVLSGQVGNSSALWTNQQRFGDVGGQRLGGFVGGLWAAGGSEALAWGWSGGWRRWRCMRTSGAATSDEVWTEVGALTGHVGPVKSIAWSPDGEYLISTGLDQTTRLHAALPATNSSEESMLSWHEVGRPQVHGYDLLGVVSLDPLRFVSVADEKVARVFGAPRGFVQAMRGLRAINFIVDEETLPVSATVRPLGLSNKATSDDFPAPPFSMSTSRRPFEAELASITLWPEVEKVFGHGYESITIGVSSSRKLFATACRATTAKHAVVRIYDTENFQPFGQPLEGHTLTVTRIAFSPDDQLVLTVSRDRTWRLFHKEESGYVPIAVDKSHTRIIWDGAWAPEGDVFATASRDKTVKIWQCLQGDFTQWTAVVDFRLSEAVTAIAFAPLTESNDRRVLAVGLETGNILFFTSVDVVNWQMSLEIKAGSAHIDHIHQLAWRPGRQVEEHRQIASCAEDGTLKIFAVHGGAN